MCSLASRMTGIEETLKSLVEQLTTMKNKWGFEKILIISYYCIFPYHEIWYKLINNRNIMVYCTPMVFNKTRYTCKLKGFILFEFDICLKKSFVSSKVFECWKNLLNSLIIFRYIVFTKSTLGNIRLIHIMHEH